ncbi:hypothetical protein MTsPCn9_34790 [Croceitalea sp. MTPC9]|nr:hypothetical protein MTsPCn6_35360 [Croceitalea sp. MTPC6]GMN18539.1 hypothetical protein MTsPCn9_34790 [Croceitalea sp. MTPC9]
MVKTIGVFLILIILLGLTLRLFAPEPQPQGNLVDIGNCKLHVIAEGQKNENPTVVIEGGRGMAGTYYHWLNEGLKGSTRVVRYDRAGIGYSDVSGTPRQAEIIARELYSVLEKAGESPPYLMIGHSLGGPYIRVFTELYPDEVVGMFLLDSTHPERTARITSIPRKSSFKWKSVIWTYKFQGLLGDLGILMLYNKIMGPLTQLQMKGLPDEINNRTDDFLNGGKFIRASGKELEQYHNTLRRAGKKNNFGSLPVRVFTKAIGEVPEDTYQKYLKRGIDLRDNQIKSMEMQEDLTCLSTNGKLIIMKGTHTSIFTEKENADIICKEVLEVLSELK